MAAYQYSTVLDILADIPDPRKARGKRHPWRLILLLLVLGLLLGEDTPYGIGMWGEANAEQLMEPMQPARGAVARVLRHLQQHCAAWRETPDS